MAYKTGFILSLLFLVQLFILLGDIISIQMIYTNLDAVSVTVGYLISQSGRVTTQAKDVALFDAGASIEIVGDDAPLIGGIFTFRLTKEYEPLIIQKDTMIISVQRSVVIGFYNPTGKESNYVRNQRTITWNHSNNSDIWDCACSYDSNI